MKIPIYCNESLSILEPEQELLPDADEVAAIGHLELQ